MSSISSASSSTRTLTWPRSRWRWRARSMQPAGGADDDLDAVLQRLDLRLVRPAAVDAQHPHAAAACRPWRGRAATWMPSSRVGTTTRACGLPRTSSGVDSKPRGPRGDALHQQRDAEAEGLAGAGLGLADQVLAGQGERQGELLDRERGV